MSEINIQNPEDMAAKNTELLMGAEFGYFLNRAYMAAVSREPALADVEIVELPADDPSVAKARSGDQTDSGRHQAMVRFNNFDTIIGNYKDLMRDAPGYRRLVSGKLGIEQGQVTPQLLYTFSFLHELGHTAQYAHTNDLAGFQQGVKRDLEALPLGPAKVSRLINPATTEYRAMMMNLGSLLQKHGQESRQGLIDLQLEAYRNTPSEKSADIFAADTLKSDPEMMHQLMYASLQELRDYDETSRAVAGSQYQVF